MSSSEQIAMPGLEPAGPFRMECASHDGEDERDPMEHGAAPSVWRPKRTAFDAVVKCVAWAGLAPDRCIPQMRVVDLSTGAVVWRSESYTRDGPVDWNTDGLVLAGHDPLDVYIEAKKNRDG